MTREPLWQRQRRLGRAEPNPFHVIRRANGSARYLNKRQEHMHRSAFDRAGNPST